MGDRLPTIAELEARSRTAMEELEIRRRGEYIAQGVGRCAMCQGLIQVGTVFKWRKRSRIAEPVHVKCLDN